MLGSPNISTEVSNPTLSQKFSALRTLPSVNRGNVSLIAQRRHVSLFAYRVPSERVRALLPSAFGVEETHVEGRAMTWISVESFLDQGAIGHSSFEQTNYRLHVLRNGEACHWLLGTSLGSLSAVGARNLWPMLWHLGAMEFRVAYDKSQRRYREYSLQTQSQWANASWQIEDTGELIGLQAIQELPASLRNSIVRNYFLRRDGIEGQQQMRLLDPLFTRGRLKSAQCDLLERLRLLDNDEIKRPQLVAIQPALSCQFGTPSTATPTTNNRFLRVA